ncbi:MAG: DUF3368 domain-containing protein [Chloroflexota bacterium]|nr:DUF3368 domain-containing protein [Chloroflexota bacterium]
MIVSNSSPLITLAEAGQLGLLPSLYGEVVIPPAVRSEVLAGSVELLPGSAEVATARWLRVEAPRDEALVEELRRNLGAGEAEAVALAIELGADTVLLDERRARRIATGRGLGVTGVLGVLLEAKARGLLEYVRPVLDALLAEGRYRISDELYQETLRLTGEWPV